MESYKTLLLSNKAWVKERLELRADYFKELAKEQKPDFLWIGCSDSRVPAEEITGTQPGELFVHRNIANLVNHADLNALSVIQYAVEHLKVKHVIVCGHYGCGGVKAALSRNRYGMLSEWLRPIKDIHRYHKQELDLYTASNRKADRLVELNVLEQVQNLARTQVIQRAWMQDGMPALHGWVYGLDTGSLVDLVKVDPRPQNDDIYSFDFEDLRLEIGATRP
jgi:carbonic anhydrase